MAGTTSGAFPGYSNAGSYDAFLTLKSPQTFTTIQWGTAGSDKVTACTFDTTTGVFYIVGTTTGNFPGFNSTGGSADPFVTIMDRAGNLTHIQWGSTGNEYATGVAYNQRLNTLIIVGYTYASFIDTTTSGGTDAFLSVITFNSDNTYTIKNHQWGTTGNDVTTGVTIDSIYNTIYVSGYTSGQFSGAESSGSDDAFLSVFAANHPEWPPTIVQWGTNANDRCVAVASTPLNENVYCVGWTEGTFAGNAQQAVGDRQLFSSTVRKEILVPPTSAGSSSNSNEQQDELITSISIGKQCQSLEQQQQQILAILMVVVFLACI